MWQKKEVSCVIPCSYFVCVCPLQAGESVWLWKSPALILALVWKEGWAPAQETNPSLYKKYSRVRPLFLIFIFNHIQHNYSLMWIMWESLGKEKCQYDSTNYKNKRKLPLTSHLLATGIPPALQHKMAIKLCLVSFQALSWSNYVNFLFPGGPVSEVLPGDELLEVQGQSLAGMMRLEAWNLIKKLPSGPVEVLLHRPHQPHWRPLLPSCTLLLKALCNSVII